MITNNALCIICQKPTEFEKPAGIKPYSQKIDGKSIQLSCGHAYHRVCIQSREEKIKRCIECQKKQMPLTDRKASLANTVNYVTHSGIALTKKEDTYCDDDLDFSPKPVSRERTLDEVFNDAEELGKAIAVNIIHYTVN